MLEKFFSPRDTLKDVAGNLLKEKLDKQWMSLALEVFNSRLIGANLKALSVTEGTDARTQARTRSHARTHNGCRLR